LSRGSAIRRSFTTNIDRAVGVAPAIIRQLWQILGTSPRMT
jgi:hypothetical protein